MTPSLLSLALRVIVKEEVCFHLLQSLLKRELRRKSRFSLLFKSRLAFLAELKRHFFAGATNCNFHVIGTFCVTLIFVVTGTDV